MATVVFNKVVVAVAIFSSGIVGLSPRTTDDLPDVRPNRPNRNIPAAPALDMVRLPRLPAEEGDPSQGLQAAPVEKNQAEPSHTGAGHPRRGEDNPPLGAQPQDESGEATPVPIPNTGTDPLGKSEEYRPPVEAQAPRRPLN
jgi:hypothetical protein